MAMSGDENNEVNFRKVNEWSDIDVAIISPDLTDDRFNERIRLTQIAQNVDSRIGPVPFHPDTFVEEDPLVWEIKKKGILFVGM